MALTLTTSYQLSRLEPGAWGLAQAYPQGAGVTGWLESRQGVPPALDPVCSLSSGFLCSAAPPEARVCLGAVLLQDAGLCNAGAHGVCLSDCSATLELPYQSTIDWGA